MKNLNSNEKKIITLLLFFSLAGMASKTYAPEGFEGKPGEMPYQKELEQKLAEKGKTQAEEEKLSKEELEQKITDIEKREQFIEKTDLPLAQKNLEAFEKMKNELGIKNWQEEIAKIKKEQAKLAQQKEELQKLLEKKEQVAAATFEAATPEPTQTAEAKKQIPIQVAIENIRNFLSQIREWISRFKTKSKEAIKELFANSTKPEKISEIDKAFAEFKTKNKKASVKEIDKTIEQTGKTFLTNIQNDLQEKIKEFENFVNLYEEYSRIERQRLKPLMIQQKEVISYLLSLLKENISTDFYYELIMPDQENPYEVLGITKLPGTIVEKPSIARAWRPEAEKAKTLTERARLLKARKTLENINTQTQFDNIIKFAETLNNGTQEIVNISENEFNKLIDKWNKLQKK